MADNKNKYKVEPQRSGYQLPAENFKQKDRLWC